MRTEAHRAPHVPHPVLRIGDAIVQAKQAMASAHPTRLDAILGFSLLGDPALEIGR